LRYLATNLPRLHKDAFRNVSRADFQAAVDRLDQQIDGLSAQQIVVEMARIVAMVGDLHTRLEFWDEIDFRWFPLLLRRFDDGTHVVAAAKPYSAALGRQLIRVEGQPLALVRRTIAEIISHENEAKLNTAMPTYLRCDELLHALGITRALGSVRMTFDGAGGAETLRIESAAAGARLNWVAVGGQPSQPVPLYEQNVDKKYWFTLLEDSGTLYCAYNDCSEMESEPFAAFARRVLATLDEHDVHRFVLDLRHNAGGNSGIAAPLIAGLKHRPNINQTHRLFCIIGNRTASSASLNAMQLRQETEAIFVGQPTGQRPNSFGEMRAFKLPNSGVTVTYSTRYFKVSKDDPPSFMPDIRVGFTFDDYLAGRDPMLEAVFAHSDTGEPRHAPFATRERTR
jgi:hypothetical protein